MANFCDPFNQLQLNYFVRMDYSYKEILHTLSHYMFWRKVRYLCIQEIYRTVQLGEIQKKLIRGEDN